VLLTVEEPDGHVSLRCAWSEGMTWIERIGLLRAAERAELPADGAHADGGSIGPAITFTHTFATPGLHKVWGQFSRGGTVITVPFVVEVR